MHLDHTHPMGGGHSHPHKHEPEPIRDTPVTPMEELTALINYMVSHNAAHARELSELAVQLEKNGKAEAYEQVMTAVADFEKGNLRLRAVLCSLEEK